ncbi:unnamed protein product [Adineta steineri]|uniref:Uncharacterized protein n=1 Tax=Adineta steineri TaxID=433720 RepID=A0A819PKS7_9BILA|nr:unnamed protein product [Adineta steineri]CAF4014646.1 unnamed protein product [Adineta steineri]
MSRAHRPSSSNENKIVQDQQDENTNEISDIDLSKEAQISRTKSEISRLSVTDVRHIETPKSNLSIQNTNKQYRDHKKRNNTCITLIM